jgi:hypothetical protein
MKLLLLSLLVSFSALAGQSGNLFLRARVPSLYSVEITANGSLITRSNLVGRAPKPTVEISQRNGVRLVTVTHP